MNVEGEKTMPFIERVFYHNSIKTWLLALVLTVVALIAFRLFRTIVHRKIRAFAKKTDTDIDDLVADVVHHIKFVFLIVLAISLGSQVLSLPDSVRTIISKVVVITVLYQGAIWGSGLLDYWLGRVRKKKEEGDAASLMTFTALGFVGRLILWTIVVLLGLDNFGVNITALVAGLGVGGVAIALAVQNVLGDLFASMSIVLDKPFVIGDYIIVDDLRGAVEHIGLKTTRVRSLTGEQLIFANSDLLSSRIRNYKRMAERRIAFNLGVIYQTPAEKLEAIPGMIREVIETQDNTRFDRSHFKDYGDFSLNFETVYYMKTPDYLTYMDTQQNINLELFRRFEKEGIEFAYPSQTIFLEK